MVIIVINRTTGERKVVVVHADSSDASLEVIGNLLAKMIIEHGLLEKFNKMKQSNLNFLYDNFFVENTLNLNPLLNLLAQKIPNAS